MKELTKVLIITAILIAGGIISLSFAKYSSDFNFYKSEISINGTQVTETLYFQPDQSYHTLYRNFKDPISQSNEYLNNLVISVVTCSSGTPYFKDYNGQCYSSNAQLDNCYPYTENNEYGCTFGDIYGFKENSEYKIESKLNLHPQNLFLIKGNYYIKFVVYSPYKHKYLSDNLIVSGAIRNNEYYPKDNVVIYIQYNGDISHYSIIDQNDFEYDSNPLSFLVYLFALLPAIIFFLIWFFFGKDKDFNVPEQLSVFNKSRKPWEVAAYFNPIFSSIDKNFFSSILLGFYQRKVIDVKEINKEIFIKLNKFNGDEIEKQIYEILEKVLEFTDDKYKQGDYFNLKKSMKSWSMPGILRPRFMELQKDIAKKGKDFMNNIAIFIGLPLMFFSTFLSSIAGFPFLIPLDIFSTFLIFLVGLSSAILIRYKQDYYKEYLEWQAFKKYLDASFTIRTGTHKTIIMWNEYLVYATALGVSKKVVNELKQAGIITNNQSSLYIGLHASASSGFASSGGPGGGHGGAGGGGVGGGGGGGR